MTPANRLNAKIAVVGTGPAALMAVDHLSRAGHGVALFDKRRSAGRKLLVAGSSGLNITNSLPLDQFIAYYKEPHEFWSKLITNFPPQAWIQFIEAMGIGTFEGTSGRYFVEEMKASKLLQTWTTRLQSQGVQFFYEHECTGFELTDFNRCKLVFSAQQPKTVDAVCFALGGASWEPNETPLRWPGIFKSNGLQFEPFTASNVGYRVAWKKEFLNEAEGLPLKRIAMSSARARREGEAMITAYGMEGTPVYFTGLTGMVQIDLKPELDREQLLVKLNAVKENLSPMRRIKKQLHLCEASLALFFHHTPASFLQSAPLGQIVDRLKAFPLELLGPQPLTEAISSAGGLKVSELDQNLMLKKFPGFFAAGEMLDWDVPTGGFLIQGCVSQGFAAANGMMTWLGDRQRF